MVKLIKDDLTGKIFGYSDVRDNTCIYKDDVLLEESELAGVKVENAYWENGEIINKEESTGYHADILSLDAEIEEQKRICENRNVLEYLMEGNDLISCIKMIKSAKEKLQELLSRRNGLLEEYRQRTEDYYRSQNRAKDALLACRFYSAVILVIKDENRYLREWLDWHLALGFQHVYIYDNGEEDNVLDVVNSFSEEVREKITGIDWRGHHMHIQEDAYTHFMENYKEDVRWGLFIDSDEFLRFTDGETTDVNDFLRAYEDFTEIWGYEVEYDANCQETYEECPVRERFGRQTDVREGFYWKNFIQVNRIDGFLMHYAYYDPKKHPMFKNEQSNQDLFVIDHYYTKSWEEWQWKIKERGGADPYYHKALQEFFVYNPDMAYLNTGENVVQAYE